MLGIITRILKDSGRLVLIQHTLQQQITEQGAIFHESYIKEYEMVWKAVCYTPFCGGT
jgi:hypothetical protein